jgi:hypothetical protein
MIGFPNQAAPDLLVLVTEKELLMGTIENIQKLFISSIPVGNPVSYFIFDSFRNAMPKNSL